MRPRRQLDHSLRLEIHEVQVLFVDGNVITGFWRIDIDQEVDVTNERHPLRILNAYLDGSLQRSPICRCDDGGHQGLVPTRRVGMEHQITYNHDNHGNHACRNHFAHRSPLGAEE